jgi:hypothetical protein
MTDEIILELQRHKELLAERSGFDLYRLAAEIRQEEARSVAQGRTLLQPSTADGTRSDYRAIRFASA